MLACTSVLICGLVDFAWSQDDYPLKYKNDPCTDCSTNCGPDDWGFYIKNCTSFVAWRMNRDCGSECFTNSMDGGRWGEAYNWDYNAKNLGLQVDQTPAVGAIAQWHKGEILSNPNIGHVAYVEKVNDDGSVKISEYNYNNPCAFGERVIDSAQVPRYIHLRSQSPPIITSGWLPDTGQTKCYDNEKEIPCLFDSTDPTYGPFYGQDAQYHSAPMSFTKLDSSENPLPDSATSWDMVKDNNTGLIWQAGDDQNTTGRTWQEAVDYCDSLGNSWRLPTQRELVTLINYGMSPVIDIQYFSGCTGGGYWANTKINTSSYRALVSFDDGYMGNNFPTTLYNVRCVSGNPLPSGNYTDNGNGTITDTATGFVWQKSDDGSTRNWKDALAYCEDLSLGDKDDWRLPNIRELETIVDNNRSYPPIDPVFSCIQNKYWSSTTALNSPSRARAVDFSFSGIANSGHNKLFSSYYYDRYYARCVRDNQVDVQVLGAFASTQETHSQIDANETHWWDFVNNLVQNLKIYLGFGSTFNLKIYQPDGALYDEQQSDVSPIEILIPNAQPGQWRFEVTAVEVPYPNDPYVLVIAEADTDEDGIADSQDNCPDIYNPDQADEDENDIGDVCQSADEDNDGYTADVDCNDTNPSIHPDATEVCDGLDNNCDNHTDEDWVCDADKDGINNSSDQCLSTQADQIVNKSGCSIADLCPCDNAWKNHGAYVNCVTKTSQSFLASGLISSPDKGLIVSGAAQSECGKKKK